MLVSCQGKALVSQATGAPDEIVVSMPTANWKGVVGDAIRSDLESAVPYLPQPEPSFRIMFADQERGLGALHKMVRNIFILHIDPQRYTQVGLHYVLDEWADGQVVVTMNAPDTASVLKYHREHPLELTRFFSRIEMYRSAQLLST
ncbi:MAG: DUF4837 family protein, partial [Tannerella sp.]|nr:DUF4837 family protein [Tannerella sp.]